MNNDEHNSSDTDKRGLIAWFANNHVAANILMLFLVVGGLASIISMRTETFPSIDPKLITISVPYPGATPYEIADSITGRIEEALQGIEGVKRISSTATEGSGIVNIEIKDFADSSQVYDDVETAVNGLSAFPPQDAERPIINRVRVTPNVLTLAIFGDVPEAKLRYWADLVEDELQMLEGVGLTTLRGIRDYQISIDVSEEKLRQYNMSLDEIGETVARFSSDIPAGNIESKQGEILLRVQEQRYTGPEFESIALRSLPDGSVLRLGDVAEVVDGFEDVNLISKYNGRRAAFIDVKRSESQDTIEVANTVKDYLKMLSLPEGIEIVIQQDETIVLKDRINLMLRNAILGFALVFIILMLFLDLKLAIWTSAAIPISFLGGTMILNFMGYSLNMVSLFALIVVLGIVVDDGIVIGESIFEEQERNKGKGAVQRGVRAVIAPATVGVTTTMAAFAPLLFSTGTLGQIIGVIPAVVIPILLISLLEAYFILPAHLSNPKRWSLGIILKARDTVARGMEQFIEKILTPFTRLCIRWRYATVTLFLAIAIVTSGLFKSGHMRFIFFPQIESDTILISLKMPVGAPFEVTTSTVNAIEAAIETVRQEIDREQERGIIESVSVSIGSVSGGLAGHASIGSTDNSNHLAELTIQLLPSEFRDISATAIASMIREHTKTLPGIEELTFRSSLAGNDADIEIELSHPFEAKLIAASEQLEAAIKEIPGSVNVSNSFDRGKTEYLFKLNEEGYAVGLTPEELGRQLRSAYFGLEVQRIQRGASEVIVYLRYPKEERETLTALRRTRIRLRNGSEVPLGSITDKVEQVGFSKIQTANGRRIVSVTADTDANIATPNMVIADLKATTLPNLLQRFPSLSYEFAGETKDQAQDLASLGRNMLIALMIIYVILGGQLRSYIQPFIIMSVIPFGIIGAILGHFLLGYDLTFISLFGIVALTGVVVNDSVVLIDYLNQQHRNGTNLADSASMAISRRFRPILLTSLSTCIGLLPMLLETSIQAQFLIPMVVSLSMGVLFVTPIVLVLVPCLLLILEDIRHIKIAPSKATKFT